MAHKKDDVARDRANIRARQRERRQAARGEGGDEQRSGRKLEAAVQEFHALIELAQVHVAEAQVVEEVGIIGIRAEQLLQVDAGLVGLAGMEELEDMAMDRS